MTREVSRTSSDGRTVISAAFFRTTRDRVHFADAPPVAPEPVRRPAKVAQQLALAHHLQNAIDRGAVADRTTIVIAQVMFLVSYVGLNAVLGVLLVLVPEFRRFGFAGVIASVLLSELVLRRRTLRDWSSSLLIRAAAIQGVAFIIWNLDRAHIVCDPQFPLQGHAVWHALGAVASFQLWRYFTQASVRPARTAPP